MDPSTVRHSIAALFRPKLVFWAGSLAVGAYLGYVIAANIYETGFAFFNAIVAGLIALAILFVLVVVAIILALVPDKSGRPTARAAIVGGLLLAVGVGLGWVITPVLWPEFRQPLILEAPGTMTLALDGIDGYAGGGDALATCRSEVDTEEVASVEAVVVGTIGPAVVAASVWIQSGNADLMVWIAPAADDEGTVPMWQGPEGVVEVTNVDGGGRIVFSGIRLTARDEAGRAPEGWPAELSGTLTWSCGAWIRT
jgi:hypothetical protein